MTTHLVGEAVEGGEGHDDELLRREEVDDEEERGGLEHVKSKFNARYTQ